MLARVVQHALDRADLDALRRHDRDAAAAAPGSRSGSPSSSTADSGYARPARRQTSTTSRTEAVRQETRESSGRSASSKRPDSSCSQLGHQRVEAAAALVHQHDVARADALRRRPPRWPERRSTSSSDVCGSSDTPPTLCGGPDGLPHAPVQRRRSPRGPCARRRSSTARRPARGRARRGTSRRPAARSQPQPYSAAACAKSSPCGVATCVDELRGPRRPTGRKLKIPPPSLSISTITSFAPEREAASSPPTSWASATSPISSTAGPGDAAATPNAVETVPSMPFAPRFDSTRNGSGRTGKNVSTSRIGIEEATTSVASARQPGARAPRPPAARSAPPARRRRRSRPPPPGRPRCQSSSQARSPPRDLLRQRLERRSRGSAATTVPTAPAGSCQARLGVERRPAARRATPATRAAAWTSAGRRPAARAPARAPPPTRPSAAARRSAPPPPGPGARRTAGRRAAGARPLARTPPATRPAAGRAPSARPRSPRAAARAARPRAREQRVARLARACRGRVTHGRPPSRPGAISASGSPPASGTSGSRSAKFRCTGPGRPSTAVQNARQASWRSQRRRAGDAGWSSTSKNHFAARPVEPDLVDRLPGADLAQLRRPVRGQDEQRHARLVRLDHRRRVVRRRRAGRAGQHRGHPRGLRRGRARRTPPQRSSRCDVARSRGARASDSTSGVEREPGDVQASRSAAADELVDEGAQAEVGVGSGHDGRRMPPALVLLHGFTQTRQSWRRTVQALGRDAIARSPRTSRATARPRSARASFAAATAYVRALEPSDSLAGYSHGRPDRPARGAHAQPRLERLILVGASPGPRRTRRSARRAARADDALADRIEADRRSRRSPPSGARSRCSTASRSASAAAANADRLRNTPHGLAAALRGLGTGRDGAAVGPPARARRCRSR